MSEVIVKFLIRLRWIYFHLHPFYFKFYMDSEHTEAHFQHIKTGAIHSQLIINPNQE